MGYTHRVKRSFYVSGTEYKRFLEAYGNRSKVDPKNKAIRIGQAFYAWFKLDKMTPTCEIDKIYESETRRYVESYVDFSQ